jgi:transcriptional regulator with XRE-family HTH domain
MQNKYGVKIRKLREKHGDTLEEAAKKLNMSFSTLGKYERGERKVTPDFLEEVSEVYDVKLSYFFGIEKTVPEELKKIGIEWITFIEDMKEKELSPEQIKSIIEFVNNFKK